MVRSEPTRVARTHRRSGILSSAVDRSEPLVRLGRRETRGECSGLLLEAEVRKTERESVEDGHTGILAHPGFSRFGKAGP